MPFHVLAMVLGRAEVSTPFDECRSVILRGVPEQFFDSIGALVVLARPAFVRSLPLWISIDLIEPSASGGSPPRRVAGAQAVSEPSLLRIAILALPHRFNYVRFGVVG